MSSDLFQFGLTNEHDGPPGKIYGVTPALVIDNIDLLGEARVQISLPWAAGLAPWARIATTMAGFERGTYFIPQIGDEVLVAFNQGDITEPYIIGGLWNSIDRPPSLLPTDPVMKRIIRTPIGQEVVFDDSTDTITISNTLNALSLNPAGATLAGGAPTAPGQAAPPGAASISLDVAGNVTITGLVSITLQAPSIKLNGTNVQINGAASTSIDGGGQCTIAGAQITIG